MANVEESAVSKAFVAWARPRAVPIGPADQPCTDAAAHAIRAVVGDARVIGFGEISHGVQEPLAYRNWLVRLLVERHGLAAVALESGIAQARRVDDYVRGGSGTAQAAVREGLGWNFDDLVANAELAAWLRAWNAEPSRHAVRFYGMDVTGGDRDDGMRNARAALDGVAAHLAQVSDQRAQDAARELAACADRFSPPGYAVSSGAERTRLLRALRGARRHLAARGPAPAPQAEEQAWAERMALDCNRLLRIFAAWPDDPANMQGWFDVTRVRDLTMADHMDWILGREGARGPVLVFAANGHVGASPFWPAILLRLPNPPATLGQHLRARLGDAYRAIGTAAREDAQRAGRPVGSVNRGLAAASAAPFLIDTRGAPPSADAARPDTMSCDVQTTHGRLRDAFDGILFLEPLTPALRFAS